MSQCSRELTLMELLWDPLVRTVMAADRVDLEELTAELDEAARALERHAKNVA